MNAYAKTISTTIVTTMVLLSTAHAANHAASHAAHASYCPPVTEIKEVTAANGTSGVTYTAKIGKREWSGENPMGSVGDIKSQNIVFAAATIKGDKLFCDYVGKRTEQGASDTSKGAMQNVGIRMTLEGNPSVKAENVSRSWVLTCTSPDANVNDCTFK